MSDLQVKPVLSKPVLFLFFAIYGVLCFWGEPISGNDEPRVAGIAREMALTGEYAMPHLNGEPFLEYPSLGYLPLAFVLDLSDSTSDLLAHAVSVLVGLATLFLTYRLGAVFGGPDLGVFASIALATTVGFSNLMPRVMVDPVLLFFITLSFWGYATLVYGKGNPVLPVLAFYGGAACGLLTKGLIGIAIPFSVAGVDLIRRRQKDDGRRIHLAFGTGVVVIVLGLWAYEIYNEHGIEVLAEFARQSLWRFSASSADHAAPFYAYLLPLCYVLLPWSLLFLVLLWHRFQDSQSASLLRLQGPERFPAIWFFVVLLGLSIASAKRNVYLAPLYPAFALLVGLWCVRLKKMEKLSQRTAHAGLIVALLLIVVTKQFLILPRENRERWQPAMNSLILDSAQEEVVLFRPVESLRGAAVFYLGRTVPSVQNIEELRRLMSVRPHSARVVALFEGVEEVKSSLRPEEILSTKEWKIGRRALAIFEVADASKRTGGG